jgi:hypothetical protein
MFFSLVYDTQQVPTGYHRKKKMTMGILKTETPTSVAVSFSGSHGISFSEIPSASLEHAKRKP